MEGALLHSLLLSCLTSLPPQVKFALDQARKAYGGAPALAAQLPGDDALPGLQGFRLQARQYSLCVCCAPCYSVLGAHPPSHDPL